MVAIVAAALVLCLCVHSISASTPALFLFGDSTVDTGNNNFLATRARANFSPYGTNFFSNATGRFSDGQLVPDFIASYLGLPYPPPYFTSGDLSQGVNFGSANSGILRWPGNGLVMHLSEQVDHFQRVRNTLVNTVGFNTTSVLIENSIFYISTGTLDLLNLLRIWRTGIPPESRTQLLHEFDQQIQRLYSFGARKMVIVTPSAVGCAPANLMGGRCSRAGVRAAAYYNAGLALTLGGLRHTYQNANFVLANYANVMLEVKAFPRVYDFKNTARPCCPLTEPWRMCYAAAPVCDRSSDYMFWDISNPTEAFNSIVAQRFWNGTSPFITPYNIAQMAENTMPPPPNTP